MTVELNHTIVPARDARASATFLAAILGLNRPVPFGPFWAVALDNGVTLDFQQSDEEIPIEHYAFLVSEGEFDAIFERIRARGLDYWAGSGARAAVRDQSQRRRARRVLERSRWALSGDHHPTLRKRSVAVDPRRSSRSAEGW
jgi:catechol 2,3-dioxygenase-like lactoylglutathione lyase family enzyme